MKLNRLTTLLVALTAIITVNAARVDTLTIKTKLLPRAMKVTMVTPDAAADKSKTFPSVYLLNGYGGDHRSWLNPQSQLKDLADRYGIILIAPDGMDSWYFDSAVNPKMKMESFFVKELVPFVDANFPTKKSASQRAITGLSMGGHGALWLALRHPDVWKNCGSTSGGVNLAKIGSKYKIPQALGKNASAKVLADHSVTGLLKSYKAGQNNIIFDCGTSDMFYPINLDLHNKMMTLKIPHDFISRPGNHCWPYWNNSILYQMVYFDQAFRNAK